MEIDKKDLQGGAMAILYKGKVIYQDTFGYSKKGGKPITSSTFSPLASVSKAVTAVALAQLVETGKLDLEQLMDIPYLKHKVSWKHLLSHTTGYRFLGNYMIEKGMLRNEILLKLGKLKPSYTLGKSHFYSNIFLAL